MWQPYIESYVLSDKAIRNTAACRSHSRNTYQDDNTNKPTFNKIVAINNLTIFRVFQVITLHALARAGVR